MDKSEAIQIIESYRELKKGWNGYKADSFSEKVINKALELIKELSPIPQVFPTGRNSIQFEWTKLNKDSKNELYLEMEIFGDKIEIYNQAEIQGEELSIGGN